MNGYFYCFLVVCITPIAMAITCYKCEPKLSVEHCKEPKNVTDCDKDTPPPPFSAMKYDSCSTITAKLGQGSEMKMRQCGYKTLCTTWQETVCNMTRKTLEAENQTVTTCKLECCEGAKCNTDKHHDEDAGYVNAASLTITMATAILSLVMSFY